MARAHVDPEGWAKKVRRWKIIALILLVTGTIVWALKEHILPARHNAKIYAQAEEALAQGNLAEAVDCFSLISDYQDAWTRAKELAYSKQADDSFLQSLQNAELGDVVSFGTWEQDGSTQNGPEPIGWIVLSDDEDRVLLWSEKLLDGARYNETPGDITWADCTLRSYLNDTFYHTAFSPEDQLLVQNTVVENPDNAASGIDGGEDTEDHVFILSFNELLAFSTFNPNLSSISGIATRYAASQGVEVHREYRTSSWWLRGPGVSQSTVTYCDMADMPIYTCIADRMGLGVRPAMWVIVPGRTMTQVEAGE